MPTRDRFFAPNEPGNSLPAHWALGVLAQATYAGREDFIQAWAEAMGFDFGKKIQTDGVICPNVYLAGNSRQLVIAVPGTDHWMQMFDNIVFSSQRENALFGPGRMHSFFLWCAEEIIDEVGAELANYPDLEAICFTGHSLGGAVAQLLADRAEIAFPGKVKLCVTFNSPRVGNIDWARREREHRTYLYYHTHDMVCEFPPPISPNYSHWEFLTGRQYYWEHRDALHAVPSHGNIDASWAAITVTKASEAPRVANWIWPTRMATALEHSTFWGHFSKLGMRCGIASWVLPVPQWLRDHSMIGVINSMRQMDGFSLPPESVGLELLLLALPPEQYPDFVANRLGIGTLSPTRRFASGQVPGVGGAPDSPPITFDFYDEAIEASFEWSVSEVYTPPNLISVSDEFIFALTESAQRTAESPFADPLPIVADIPARPHWRFRGNDRRLLDLIAELMDAIEERDRLAASSERTAEISTRDLIIDTDELQAAWQHLKEIVWSKLYLYLAE